MTRTLMMLTAPVIVGALIAGCASSKKAASGTPATPTASVTTQDLTGTWSGHGGAQGREVPAALRLVQNGIALEGDMYVSGRADLSGPITGTVDGNTVRLALGSGFRQTSALQISPDGDRISGNMVGSPIVLTRSK